MAMSLTEMESQVRFLLGEVDRLNNQLNSSPKSSGAMAKTSADVATGSMPYSLKRILNLGFVWVQNNKVNVKPNASGGITVAAAGVGVKVRANYGLVVDANGLALKKQATMSGPAATTQITVNAGADQIDRGDLNTKLGTLKTELDAYKTAIDTLISTLQAAEVIS